MELMVRDRVSIIDNNGKPIAEGTIVNINDFREPSQKYAVESNDYLDDLLFLGEWQLVKIVRGEKWKQINRLLEKWNQK